MIVRFFMGLLFLALAGVGLLTVGCITLWVGMAVGINHMLDMADKNPKQFGQVLEDYRKEKNGGQSKKLTSNDLCVTLDNFQEDARKAGTDVMWLKSATKAGRFYVLLKKDDKSPAREIQLDIEPDGKLSSRDRLAKSD